MSANDLPETAQRGAHVASLFASIGAVYDPVAVQWDQADRKVRRFLLRAVDMSDFWAERKWSNLPADKRGEIRRKAGDLYAWLGRWVGK